MKFKSKKWQSLVILGLVSGMVLTGCGKKEGLKEEPKEVVQEVEETSEIKTLPVDYATGFSVDYLENGIKKVYLEVDDRTLYLVPEGQEVPAELKDEVVVTTPVKNVLVGSTVYGCDLRALDEVASISSVTTEVDGWYIEEVKSAMEKGDIQFVGNNKAPDYEKISQIKPEIAIVTGGTSGSPEVVAKFDEMGIPLLTGTNYMEENPIGRLEWMKLTSALYNKEDMMVDLFNEKVEKINGLTSRFENATNRPKVVWMRISKGSVTVPQSESYASEMIKMAGGDYVFADANLTEKKISLEELFDKGKDADIIVWEKMGPAPESVEAIIEEYPALKTMKAVESMNFYRTGDDYWQSTDKLDFMIEDLSSMFYPTDYEGHVNNHFIKYEK